jgi:hypothetical protein
LQWRWDVLVVRWRCWLVIGDVVIWWGWWGNVVVWRRWWGWVVELLPLIQQWVLSLLLFVEDTNDILQFY